MFTGIALGRGLVIQNIRTEHATRLTIDHRGLLAGPLIIGNSVMVSGVCLTIVESAGTHVTFDLIPETLLLSNLGELSAGDEVNLEQPLTAGGELGGHHVQGHVEGIGTIRSIAASGDDYRVRVQVTSASIPLAFVRKGFVAVDGVSLTIADWDEATKEFEFALIPEARKKTTLGIKRVGATVNLETDILIRSFLSTFWGIVGDLAARVSRLEALAPPSPKTSAGSGR